MQFKVEARVAKATLEIQDKVYKFYSPTAGQVQEFQKELDENKDNRSVASELMFEYLAKVSDCPVEVLKGLDQELFDKLFVYVISPQKKT